ncbi:MAG: 5-formyltetrahydrofolate cyclo-ligase [Clostridia bacterium]|nr:5-formyltetrahydrofolate cyclo-ligase [Clostridia bacterium]
MDNLKKELRQKILAVRSALPVEEVDAKSRLIAAHLQALPEWREAAVVMLYVAFRKEVETSGLICAALKEGKRVAVPVCVKGRRELVPSEVLSFPGDLSPGTWGILEPRPDTFRPLAPETIDLVVVPGVAFDRRGNRLGYGAGYYDNFLSKLKPGARAVALAFGFQVVETTYPDAHDLPVDLIVTEDGVIRPGR